ncbi:hypothetical protein CSKR_104210 [Clonorchis sinensis]|uniref:Uncharacterized protein n=1 Tax=Clonorchis sinensis TaxID=79923 RepID=A0A419Q209_CLOSI|nr:hypothetical protein CSKR_104210 [Clonorchis sinensis]
MQDDTHFQPVSISHLQTAYHGHIGSSCYSFDYRKAEQHRRGDDMSYKVHLSVAPTQPRARLEDPFEAYGLLACAARVLTSIAHETIWPTLALVIRCYHQIRPMLRRNRWSNTDIFRVKHMPNRAAALLKLFELVWIIEGSEPRSAISPAYSMSVREYPSSISTSEVSEEGIKISCGLREWTYHVGFLFANGKLVSVFCTGPLGSSSGCAGGDQMNCHLKCPARHQR